MAHLAIADRLRGVGRDRNHESTALSRDRYERFAVGRHEQIPPEIGHPRQHRSSGVTAFPIVRTGCNLGLVVFDLSVLAPRQRRPVRILESFQVCHC